MNMLNYETKQQVLSLNTRTFFWRNLFMDVETVFLTFIPRDVADSGNRQSFTSHEPFRWNRLDTKSYA